MPTNRRPIRSAMLDIPGPGRTALLLLIRPLLWPRVLVVFGKMLGLPVKWCWIQGRITVNCWRLGMTRAEVRASPRRR